MSLVDEFAQPHCPSCRIVMRDEPGGFRCPSCNFLDDRSTEQATGNVPPEFDGPDLDQYRRATTR